jgi:hypothetical protein
MLRIDQMRTLICLLTILAFAAHASLGCGAHRTCEHSTTVASEAHTCHKHSHSVAAHHRDHNATADHEEGEPCDPCSHSDCSYVKAETQQVDAASPLASSFALLPVSLTEVSESTNRFDEPVCQADLSSTQLYVWHCALII